MTFSLHTALFSSFFHKLPGQESGQTGIGRQKNPPEIVLRRIVCSALCSGCRLYLRFLTQEINGCLADYLIENGAILPPCKVGTYVYFITDVNCQYFTIKFGRVYEIVITSNDNLFLSIVEYDESDNVVDEWDIPKCQWGKTVFLTREDAVKALREREGE